MASLNLPNFTNPTNVTNIRVVAASRPPYAYQNASSPYGWSGMLIQLIPVLFQVAGYNASFTYYQSPDNGGGSLTNGTWNGVTGELVAKRADIAAFSLTLSPGRPDYIDMSYSFDEKGLSILVLKQPSGNNGNTLFLKPFATDLWITLIAAVIGMGLCLHFLAYVSPLGGYAIKRMRNVTAGSDEQRYVIEDTTESFFVDVLMAAVANAPEPRGKSWALRLPSVAFYFVMLITISSYTANFASYLTVNQFSTVVSNLQDLKKGGLNFTINKGGATQTYFTQSLDPTILTLQPQLTLVDATAGGLDSVRSGGFSAYIGDNPTLRYYAGMQPCDLAVVGETFGPGVYTLGLQQNSPYTTRINDALLTLKGNGYLDELQRTWIDDVSVCNNDPSSPIGALGPGDFSGLWYLLLAAIAFGFLWAMLERLVIWFFARNPALLERAQRWQRAAAAGSKKFDFTRSFARSLSRTASIFVRGNSKSAEATARAPACAGPDGAPAAAGLVRHESSTEKAARLAVEGYERERAKELAAKRVGRLW